MKLAFFDDFKLGVVKGDAIHDVSAVVRDIPHVGPGDLISSLIARFDDYRARLEARGHRRRHAAGQRPHPAAAAQAGQHRLHGGELHGERHAGEARADQRLPQGANGDHRAGRHHGAARRAGNDLRGRGRNGRGHRQARHAMSPAAQAMDYIFGYINFIDGSARGLPPAGNVFFQMKSRDTFAPIGPYLVTKDEIADPQKLPIKLWVNGELKQSFNTDDMAHNIARCIEWVTSIHTLEPGDILATGTNHRGLSSFMDGDVVELETQGLGRLQLQHPRRAEAHVVAGDAAGPAAEGRGRPDARS